MLVKRKGEITKIFQVSGSNSVGPYEWNWRLLTTQWSPGSWVQGPLSCAWLFILPLGTEAQAPQASACISSPSQGRDKTPKMTLTCHCKALSRCTGIQDSIGMWSSLSYVILTVSRQDKNQRSGWPAVPICSKPRGAPGCGMFSAKIDTVLDKPGWLVGANYHLACPQVPEKTWLRV